MISLNSVLASLDGVAQRQELLQAGLTGRQLAAAVHLGRVARVRKGWYALPGTETELVRAIRVGGRLACVSAAKHYGWATAHDLGLHVGVASNASRLRSPDNAFQRMPREDDRQLTLHWGTHRNDRTRLVTSKRETVLQLAHCQSPELTIAAYDSFLHTDPAGSSELDQWISELPRHVLVALEVPNPLCHSFLESIGRIRLAREGVRGRHQVKIPGVGRVDMLIDGWLIIEWDGLEHHDNGPAHDEDCRRDAVAASMGYTTLRFTYSLVMFHWYLVIGAIRGALSGIRTDTARV